MKYIYLLALVLLIPIISSANYNDCTVYGNCWAAKETSGTFFTNNTNSSRFWGNYFFGDYDLDFLFGNAFTSCTDSDACGYLYPGDVCFEESKRGYIDTCSQITDEEGGCLGGYAKYQFTNNNFNGTGNFTTIGYWCNATNCYTLADFLVDTTGGTGDSPWTNNTLITFIKPQYPQNIDIKEGNFTTEGVVTANRFVGDDTISRRGNFNCTGTNVLQNVTSNSSGIFGQCVAVSSSSTYNLTYDNHINNGTIHNSTFLYNQTTPAITDINSRFWNITQTWNITQLYNITQINSFNSSWSSTFNLTYNNLLNQNCPAGKVVNGTLSNGAFICTTDQTGGVPNWLNTSINMFINKSYPQSLLINNSGNFTVIGERCIGTPDTCLSYGEGNEAGCLAHDRCFFDYDDVCDNGGTAPCCFGTATPCNKYSTTTCSGQDGCLIGNDTVFEVRTTEGDLFGTGSVALAGGDTFGSKGSVAMGLSSYSMADNCIAIGKGAVCIGDGGFAFGSGSYAATDAFSVKANVGVRSIGIGCEVGADAICIGNIGNVQNNVIVLGKEFTAIDEEHSIQFGFDNLLLKLNLTTTEVYNNLVTKNVTATQYHNQLISVYTLIGTTGNTECNYMDNAIAGVTWTCQTCIDTGGTARTCGTTLVTLNANCLCKED